MRADIRLRRLRPETYQYVHEVWNGELKLVRVLAIRFMNDENIGQAALDVEIAVLI